MLRSAWITHILKLLDIFDAECKLPCKNCTLFLLSFFNASKFRVVTLGRCLVSMVYRLGKVVQELPRTYAHYHPCPWISSVTPSSTAEKLPILLASFPKDTFLSYGAPWSGEHIPETNRGTKARTFAKFPSKKHAYLRMKMINHRLLPRDLWSKSLHYWKGFQMFVVEKPTKRIRLMQTRDVPAFISAHNRV